MRGWFLTFLASVLTIHNSQHSQLLVKSAGNHEFIKAQGHNLMLNSTPFHGNGFNAYWLMLVASDDQVTSTFQAAAKHGLTIARTWAFGEAEYSPLQYSPGSYNEHMFLGLDFVISEAHNYGIKLILSLVNNYDDFGGKKRYVDWARERGDSNLTSEDDFFTSSVVKGYYKNHIKVVLTRENSITGIAYRDDPTIMAWELMNEPRCPTDPSGKTLQGWIEEMASYVKSIDSNHLLEIGLEGFYGQSVAKEIQNNPHEFQVGTDFLSNNQIPDIDFATVHSYPDQWLSNQSEDDQLSFLSNWHECHIRDAQSVLRKPILLAEFGKSSKETGYTSYKRDVLLNMVYATVFSSAKGGGAAVGGLFSQLLTERMDGLRDGYEIIFSESPSTASLIAQQSRMLNDVNK